MKRFLKKNFVLMLLLLFSMTVPVYAATDETTKFKEYTDAVNSGALNLTAQYSCEKGTTLVKDDTFNYVINGSKFVNIDSVTVTYEYDPNKIEFVSATFNEKLTGDKITQVNEVKENEPEKGKNTLTVGYKITDDNYFAEDGTLVTLAFKALGDVTIDTNTEAFTLNLTQEGKVPSYYYNAVFNQKDYNDWLASNNTTDPDNSDDDNTDDSNDDNNADGVVDDTDGADNTDKGDSGKGEWNPIKTSDGMSFVIIAIVSFVVLAIVLLGCIIASKKGYLKNSKLFNRHRVNKENL